MLAEGDHLRKLFLGGLSPNSNEDSIRGFYRQFGEVLDVKIVRDLSTGRSRGFGFITFKDASCVEKAQAARPHNVDGKIVEPRRAINRPEVTKSGQQVSSGRKIFVGGLKDIHDDRALKEHFQQYGHVLNVRILRDKITGRSRGFAYIEFEDYDSADKAALQKHHKIKQIEVDVKKSNYKPDPSRQPDGGQQQQHQGGYNGPTVAPGGPPGASPYPPAPYYYPPYNAWGAPPAGYPQPPPYGPPQPSGAAPPPQWNGYGYAAPPAPVPPAGGWYGAPPADQQNFGNYQQSYNGGPQKGGKLQNNRSAPYRS